LNVKDENLHGNGAAERVGELGILYYVYVSVTLQSSPLRNNVSVSVWMFVTPVSVSVSDGYLSFPHEFKVTSASDHQERS
jgi:hypothetical protein